MEEAFEKLKKQGKTDVNSLVQWMKDSKIIEAADDKARALFDDVSDKSSVEFDKFKKALAQIAEQQKKKVEDLSTSLMAQAPKLLEAMQAGASAFKEALTKAK